jgi:hypothetical protein
VSISRGEPFSQRKIMRVLGCRWCRVMRRKPSRMSDAELGVLHRRRFWICKDNVETAGELLIAVCKHGASTHCSDASLWPVKFVLPEPVMPTID